MIIEVLKGTFLFIVMNATLFYAVFRLFKWVDQIQEKRKNDKKVSK